MDLLQTKMLEKEEIRKEKLLLQGLISIHESAEKVRSLLEDDLSIEKLSRISSEYINLIYLTNSAKAHPFVIGMAWKLEEMKGKISQNLQSLLQHSLETDLAEFADILGVYATLDCMSDALGIVQQFFIAPRLKQVFATLI
jgi:hypothetical protein